MRMRWRFTILWTVVCVLAIWSVIDGEQKKPVYDCFENCLPANGPVLLIVAVWLTVLVIAAWLWSRATHTGD